MRNKKGKAVLLNSYSPLQDKFFEGMRAAGYDNIERGERGSTAEHLSVIAYKVQQEQKRLAALEKHADKKEKRLDKLDAQIVVKEKAKATLAEVDAMGKPALLGGVNFTDDEAKKLKSLAKKGVGVDKHAENYKKKIAALEDDIRYLNDKITDWQQSYQSVARDRDAWKANYERLWSEVKDFIGAIRSAPMKLLAFIHEHLPKSQNREVR